MTEQPPGGYPPPQGGGYPPPQPPQRGGYPPQPPQGGGYPPPQPPPGGGYPPPQPPPGGGYPPPQPPPGGGYPPPPPQSGGYPPPPGGYPPAGGPGYGGYGTQQPFDVGEGFKWAWNKFSKNAAPLVIATLVYVLIAAVIEGIFIGLVIAMSPEPDYASYDSGFSYSFSAFSLSGILVNAIGVFVLLVVGYVIQSAYLSGVLDIANGQEVTVGSFFKPRNIGNVVVAGLIAGVLTAIGYALCYIPGMIVAFFLIFTIVALLDRNLAPVDAIKNSFETVKNNVGNALLAYLIMAVIGVVGLFACCVGFLVAAPVSALFLVYTYRRLTGGQVAPLTP